VLELAFEQRYADDCIDKHDEATHHHSVHDGRQGRQQRHYCQNEAFTFGDETERLQGSQSTYYL
jgi:hypothetical protein